MKKQVAWFSAGVLGLLLGFPGIGSAQIREGSFSLTPQAGGFFFEDGEPLDNGMTGGLGIGYNVTKVFALEGSFNYIRTTPKHGGETLDGYMLREDAVFHLAPNQRLVPYVAGGLGWLWLDGPATDRHARVTPNFGGGVKGFLTENVAIRADFRRVLPTRPFNENLMVTMGVEFLFGGKQKPAPVPAPPPAPEPPPPAPEPDSDNDGVVDSRDKCPNTPAGVKVNSDGCPFDTDGDGVYDYLDKCPNTPAGVKVNGDGCPFDADGDGVYDYLDKCPNTPAGVKVNSDGCPFDTDGDGVYDYLDKCPDTARDLRVTPDGCPILIQRKVTKTLDIQFDTDKSDIKPEYRERLKEVADFMNKYPQTSTVIEGHTDSVGSAKYNVGLSQRRADSVRNYLVENFGISADRLETKGYGEEKPVASNDTAEGRAQNRRIEATFNAQTEYYEKK
jgi:OOP family OmpA-OmpF porin